MWHTNFCFTVYSPLVITRLSWYFIYIIIIVASETPWKSTFSITPLSFDASSTRNSCEYLHTLFIARNYRHVFWNRVRNGRSRSSKVIDFGTNRNHVCNFLLVINSKIGPLFPISEILQVFCSEQRPSPLFHANFWGVPRSEGPKQLWRYKTAVYTGVNG